MRSWSESTFVFVSTNGEHIAGGVEERWLPVMAELVRLGSTVQFLCVAESPLASTARSFGVTVAPYILDNWNVIRSRSRLRKYLKRYEPVAVHSTGIEADLLVRWAARVLQDVAVITTIPGMDIQGTRRRRPVDAVMRRFDETGITSSAVVFVGSEDLIGDIQAIGVPAERIVLDPDRGPTGDHSEGSVERHLSVYRGLMAGRGSGS